LRKNQTNDSWNLSVKIHKDSAIVTFKITEFSESEFTCENMENDFPNKIKYWKSGANIKASVSNFEMEIPFEFEKVK